ncbi:hypothetical protein ACNTMW_30930 [Planosporangium sp. 12N6]|uniref:hypothetical protein n=1 Tax=Planosporangium spinosum TaxID=3402278 RepID=UPI003CFB656C
MNEEQRPVRPPVPSAHGKALQDRAGWRAVLPTVITVGVLLLSGALVIAGEALWGLAAVLFGLAAVLTAASRYGWRWDRDRGHERDDADVIEQTDQRE